MKSRAAAKDRKLLFLAAVCLASSLLLSPTAEASRGSPAAALNLEPPAPRWNAEAPQHDLFHLEDDLLVEILTGVEPEHHQALLEHRRLELLPSASWTSAIQKPASGVSTSDLGLNVKKPKPLKPELRWTVPFYAKARFYDPEVGRFLTEDPAEPDLTTPPSLHKYLYAYGNPTRYWDPLGREPQIKEFAQNAFEVADDPEAIRNLMNKHLGEGAADRVDPAMIGAILQRVGGSAEGVNKFVNLSWLIFSTEEEFEALSPEFKDEIRNDIVGFFQTAENASMAAAWAHENPREAGMFLLKEAGKAGEAGFDLLVRAATGDPLAEFQLKKTLYGASIDLAAMFTGAGLAEGGSAVSTATRGGSWVDNMFASAKRWWKGKSSTDLPGPDTNTIRRTPREPTTLRRGGGIEPHPDDPNIPGGATNYRGRYQAATTEEGIPRLPDDWDVHHGIPQQLRNDPRVGNLDIDSPRETSGVQGYSQPGPETNVHSIIDQEWRRFFRDHPNATQTEILNFRDFMDWRYEHTYWENIQRATGGTRP